MDSRANCMQFTTNHYSVIHSSSNGQLVELSTILDTYLFCIGIANAYSSVGIVHEIVGSQTGVAFGNIKCHHSKTI